MNEVCNSTFFLAPPPGVLGRGQRSNIIKFQLQGQFQFFFLPNFVCLLTHERYKTYIRQDFHLAAWVMPQGSDLGVLWGGLGAVTGKEFFSMRQWPFIIQSQCDILKTNVTFSNSNVTYPKKSTSFST